MRNWEKRVNFIGNLRVEKTPSHLLIHVSDITGSNPWELIYKAGIEADNLASYLEKTLNMELGRGELCRKPHIASLDPLVKDFESKISRLEEKVKVCFAQCSLEAWLLADNDALKSTFGINVREIQNPESIENPKEKLSKLIGKSPRRKFRYIKTVDAPKIASKVNPKKLEEKCNSFKQMIEEIKDPP